MEGHASAWPEEIPQNVRNEARFSSIKQNIYAVLSNKNSALQ